MVHSIPASEMTQLREQTTPAADEVLLQHLSPQGAAKLNADAAKGIPFEHAMHEIRMAYGQLQYRRQMLNDTISPDTREYIESLRLNRPLTTDEMLMFVSVKLDVLKEKIGKLNQKGQNYEDILEELVIEHCQRALTCVSTGVSSGRCCEERGEGTVLKQHYGPPSKRHQSPVIWFDEISQLRHQVQDDCILKYRNSHQGPFPRAYSFSSCSASFRPSLPSSPVVAQRRNVSILSDEATTCLNSCSELPALSDVGSLSFSSSGRSVTFANTVDTISTSVPRKKSSFLQKLFFGSS